MKKISLLLGLMFFVGWGRGVMAAEPVWQRVVGSDIPLSVASYYGVASDESRNRVYLVGGYTASNAHTGTNQAFVGHIGSDGRINWQNLPNYPRNILGNYSYFDSVRNRLVVVGGDTGNTVINEVKSIAIDSATGLANGGWVSETSLPLNLHFMAGTIYGGKVFLFGGRDSSGNGRDTIYWRNYGTNDSWTLYGQRMPYWGDSMAVVVSGGRIYIGGGQQENTSMECDFGGVYMASISDSGQIGQWQSITGYPTSLHGHYEGPPVWPVLAKRSYHQMVVVGGYIYVGPGGARGAKNCDFNSSTHLSVTMRTYRAPILADGRLGAWEQYGTGDDQSSRMHDLMDWEIDQYSSNSYGWVINKNKIYLIGGMNYANVSRAVYSLDLSGQGAVATSTPVPTLTPVPAVVTPACIGSSGGGIINADGSVTINMTGNVAVDSGVLHVFNREYLVSGIPQRVKFGGVPVSITNGVKSADGKTISFQVRYSDLNKPDSNFNNSYLYQLQFNGVLTKGGVSTNYDGNCVKLARLEPRPGTVVATSTPIATITSVPPLVGGSDCAVGLPAKNLGNANCDTKINILDFDVWYEEYQKYKNGGTPTGGWRADFNNDDQIDLVDLSIWKTEWAR